MTEALSAPPIPRNEPVLGYPPGSPERAALKARLAAMSAERLEIPCSSAGARCAPGARRRGRDAARPRARARRRTTWPARRRSLAAIDAAAEALADVGRTARGRTARRSFCKAAELLAGPWRQTAERGDDARPVEDRPPGRDRRGLRAHRLLALQPVLRRRDLRRPAALERRGVWNRMEHRPLEGFVFAVTPFNFTSIAGNLPTAPALMGNTVVWKPASTAVLSRLLHHAPPRGGRPAAGRDQLRPRPRRRGRHAGAPAPGPGRGPLHRLDRRLPRHVAHDRRQHRAYRRYPRIVGETGGKDFIFAHPSADVDGAGDRAGPRRLRVPGPEVLRRQPRLHPALASGRRCTSGSWPTSRASRMGDVADFRTFMGAVIDAAALRDIRRRLHRPTRRPTRTPRSSPAASATTRGLLRRARRVIAGLGPGLPH